MSSQNESVMNANPQKAREIFLAAVKLAPAEWDAFLNAACEGDQDLRLRVSNLLRAHGEIGSFLEGPAAATLDEPIHEGPGTIIGKYKLLEKIGEGGFGVVFMAEQTQPVRRKVALKILKPGMDTRQVVARFEAERQALAIMDHPNIAKVHDGGATGSSSPAASEQPGCLTSGRPYFVMELVKGVPITEFCDQNHLTPRQRLELFIPVCQAVQHAHQKGIIHRDLKPSNVLVSRHDTTPVPKIIDFGVAKALAQTLTDKTLFTGIAQMVGTPLYMSPEQAGMSDLDIDTRSDIYSLGVLLYELLTGTTPFDKERFKRAAYDEIRRIIREEEPPKPSARLSESKDSLPSISANRHTEPAKLTKLVRGELDWIVMKALEKDRNRRYETANGFAADVQRYLNDEQVQACPPSAGYRLQKFVRRNKTGAVIAALILFFILLSGAGIGWMVGDRALRRAAAEIAVGQARDEEKKQRALAEDREKATHRYLFGANLALFARAWEAGRVSGVYDLLDHTRPEQTAGQDLRGWEWYHIHRKVHSEVVRFRGHGGHAQAAVFSPDGSRVASIGADGVLFIWDPETGEELHRFAVSEVGLISVAFSPNGDELAVGCRDASGGLIDLATGKLQHRLRGHVLGVNFVTYSRDGRTLATAGADNVIKIWHTETGKETATLVGHEGEVRRLWFHSDGKRLASVGDDRVVRFWSLPDGKEDFAVARKGISPICALSPDLGRLATWSARTEELVITDSESGAVRDKFPGYKLPLRDLVFGHDGRFLAVADELGDADIWDLQDRRLVLNQRGWPSTVSLSRTGDRVVCVCDDDCVKIWSTRSRSAPIFRGHDGWVRRVAFHPEGKILASGDATGSIRLWNVSTGATLRTLGIHIAEKGPPDSPAPAALKAMIGKPVKHVSVFQPPTKGIYGPDAVRKVWTFEGHGGDIVALAFSGDGRTLASAGGSDVRLWDVHTGKELSVLKHPQRTSSVAFSPDGSLVATGSWDDVVRVWRVADGTEKVALEGHTDNVEAVMFHLDGRRIASAAADGSIRIWDVSAGKTVQELRGHTAAIHALALSPDGQQLASGSSDESIRVWDMESGKLRNVLAGHTSRVTGLVFLPSHDRLVSASNDTGDGRVRIWDLKIGREIVAFPPPQEFVHSIAFDPVHQRLAVSVARGIVLWEASRSEEVALASAVDPKSAAAPRPVLFSPDSNPRVLGFQRLKELPKMHDKREYTLKPTAPRQEFLVAIVSVPHASLYPTRTQHEALKEKYRKNPEEEDPVGPARSYALYDPSRFNLVLADGKTVPATAIGPLPWAVDRDAGGFNAGITVEKSTSTLDRRQRALIAVAWEMDATQAVDHLRLQLDKGEPVLIPSIRLDGYRGDHSNSVSGVRARSARSSSLLRESRTYSIY
jgi:WD40 repeat protein/serine/threonine protein kinase